MKINENDLAIEIAKLEGKKIAVNIGQIKEILNITLQLLARYRASEVMELVERNEVEEDDE